MNEHAQERSRALLRAAERITVDLIAQPPLCADPSLALSDIVAQASAEGFTRLPVRSGGGAGYTLVVHTAALKAMGSWEELKSVAVPIQAAEIVAEATPVLRLLDRLHENESLFVMGQNGVKAIVTAYDLNQPAAHQCAFALALVTEGEIARLVIDQLRQDDNVSTDDARIERALARHGINCKREIARWRERQTQDIQLPLVAELSFAQKQRLFGALGLGLVVAAKCGVRYAEVPERLVQDLEEIRQLRNDVAHDRAGLTDHRVMARRMRLARDLSAGVSQVHLRP